MGKRKKKSKQRSLSNGWDELYFVGVHAEGSQELVGVEVVAQNMVRAHQIALDAARENGEGNARYHVQFSFPMNDIDRESKSYQSCSVILVTPEADSFGNRGVKSLPPPSKKDTVTQTATPAASSGSSKLATLTADVLKAFASKELVLEYKDGYPVFETGGK